MAILQKSKIVMKSIQHYGFIETASMIWSILINRGAKRLVLVALSKPRPIPKAIEASKNHIFKFASVEEIESVQVFLSDDPDNRPSDNDVKLVEEGIARCLLQLDDTNLVGYAWVWNSKLAYITDGYHVNLPDNTIYNFKGYTNAKYRGYGFQALRHLKLLELLASEGIQQLFGYVDRVNPRSLRGVKKSGYEKVGELKIITNENSKVKFNLTLNSNFWSKKPRY